MPQVIIAALLGGAALNAMVALTPGGAAFPVWTTSLALQGIVIAANDIALIINIGKVIASSNRGCAIGLVELSWGLSGVVGIPLLGVLLNVSWRLPFVALGAAAVAVAASIFLFKRVTAKGGRGRGREAPPPGLPEDGLEAGRDGGDGAAEGEGGPSDGAEVTDWKTTYFHPRVFPLVATAFLTIFLIDVFLVSMGPWLEEVYNLSLENLAYSTFVIGAAEVVAELSFSAVTDRIGPKRILCAACGIMACNSVVLLFTYNKSLGFSIFSIFVVIGCVESAIIAVFTMATQSLPSAGGKCEALVNGHMSLGHILGLSFGPLLWDRGLPGLVAPAAFTGSLAVVATVIAVFGLEKYRTPRGGGGASEVELVPAPGQ